MEKYDITLINMKVNVLEISKTDFPSSTKPWREHLIKGVPVSVLNSIYSNVNGDEVWEFGPINAEKERNLVFKRYNDYYPQGREKVLEMINYVHDNNRRGHIKAVKTSPHWTWYYKII